MIFVIGFYVFCGCVLCFCIFEKGFFYAFCDLRFVISWKGVLFICFAGCVIFGF